MALSADGMERTIREYFDACNAGDRAALAACFTENAVHYFPAGTYGGPFVGASAVSEAWERAVASLGSVWTVDQVIVDPTTARAVIEWTHFKTRVGVTLRGDEWYIFDEESTQIREIRAYYACPQPDEARIFELGGFDYAGRGYPNHAPSEVLSAREAEGE